ncbi:MAG: hypothetical protein HY319_12800 [Armatimonadetes bacterium]|nr:hypothetical protein [Armatimonadota bacterium]
MRVLTWARALVVFLAALVVGGGCSTPSPEGFVFLGDQEVEFVAPRRTWEKSEKKEQIVDSKGQTVNAVVTITWDRPDKETGTISVKTGGKIQNQEIDEDLVRLLRQRLTDDRWRITQFQWITVHGLKAYALDFEWDAEIGRQVHFIYQGYAWSLEMLCPRDHAKDTRSVFDLLVDSFRFKGTATPPTPIATP